MNRTVYSGLKGQHTLAQPGGLDEMVILRPRSGQITIAPGEVPIHRDETGGHGSPHVPRP